LYFATKIRKTFQSCKNWKELERRNPVYLTLYNNQTFPIWKELERIGKF